MDDSTNRSTNTSLRVDGFFGAALYTVSLTWIYKKHIATVDGKLSATTSQQNFRTWLEAG